MTETTTEQLAEIEGQEAEYTPPDGWRVLAVGERLQFGDMTVRKDGYCYSTERVGYFVGANQRYIRRIEPQPQPEPVQVPELQAADTPATKYTPPEGWRLLAAGELVMLDDQWVRQDGSVWRSMGTEGPVSEGARYIRRIEPEPQVEPEPQPQPQPEPQAAGTPATEYTPPERWRVLAVGEVLRDGDVWVNHKGESRPTKRVGERVNDERYIRPIEPKPQPQPQAQAQQNGLVRDVTHLLQESGVLESAKAEQQIEELRSEVSHVQRLLGESRQRVTQLEELVGSLRTINEAQEKAVEAAGKENTALRLQVQNRQGEYERQKGRIEFLETLNAGNGAAIGDYIAKVAKLQSLVDTARQQLEAAATEHDSLSAQLAAVKAELVTQAETSRRLQIELDAAQQVPADSPELRQLRADLAEVTRERDQYRHCYDEVSSHLETIEKTAKAEAVEAIAEWTEPLRACGSQRLAWMVMANLPHIMRTLTGLTPED